MSNTLPNLHKKAIDRALNQEWEEAVDINLHILQFEPKSIPAYNRLGKAYEKLNQPEKAKKAYRKALNIDEYNPVANNNLDRLKKSKPKKKKRESTIIQFDFIEEPGKTKTISLTKLAPPSVLDELEASQRVNFKNQKRRISVITEDNSYIGSLPDDLSNYLLRLIKLGNKYESVVKTATRNNIEIFVREIYRSKRVKGLSSFPSKDIKSYYNLLPTDPISEAPLELTDPENPDN